MGSHAARSIGSLRRQLGPDRVFLGVHSEFGLIMNPQAQLAARLWGRGAQIVALKTNRCTGSPIRS
jgi:hypothetical protein